MGISSRLEVVREENWSRNNSHCSVSLRNLFQAIIWIDCFTTLLLSYITSLVAALLVAVAVNSAVASLFANVDAGFLFSFYFIYYTAPAENKHTQNKEGWLCCIVATNMLKQHCRIFFFNISFHNFHLQHSRVSFYSLSHTVSFYWTP